MNEQPKPAKEKSFSFLIPSFIIILSISFIPALYFLFNKKLTELKKDNTELSDIIKKLQITNESVNVRYNSELNMRDTKKDIEEKIKNLSADAAKELSGLVSVLGINTNTEEVQDIAAENDKEISDLLERIEKMKNKLNVIKAESLTKIHKKAKTDFNDKVTLLQTKANKDFILKTENEDMKNVKIKHYRRYNQTELLTLNRLYNEKMNYPHELFSSVLKRISSLPEKFIYLFDQLTKKESTFYTQIEKSQKEISEVDHTISESEKEKLNQMKSLQAKDTEVNKSSFNKLSSMINMIYKQKTQIKNTLKDFLGMRFDYKMYYDLLYNQFGKNFNSKLAYLYSKHNEFSDALNSFKNSTANKENLLFIFNTESNDILGGFLSKPFPDFDQLENYKDIGVTDTESFLFHFSTKNKKFTILKALAYSLNHINLMKTEYGIRFAIGDITNEEGLTVSFQEIDPVTITSAAELSFEEKYLNVIAGKISNKFNKEASFTLFNNYSNVGIRQKIKSFKILQLSFIDN